MKKMYLKKSGLMVVFTICANIFSFAQSGVQFQGIGEGGNQKVLVSDLEGNASWKDPITFQSKFMGASINNNQEVPLTSWFGSFDFGNVFDDNTGSFIAPQTGIYHFDVSVKWGAATGASNFVSAMLKRCDVDGLNCSLVLQNKENDQIAPNQSFGADIVVFQSNTVRLFVIQTQTGSQARSIEGSTEAATYISGHLVR